MLVEDVLTQFHLNVKAKFAYTKKSSYVRTAVEFWLRKKQRQLLIKEGSNSSRCEEEVAKLLMHERSYSY
jgi:hypothetical protein